MARTLRPVGFLAVLGLLVGAGVVSAPAAIAASPAAVTATIPVGDTPIGVAVNPATNTVFVTNGGSNTVSVISGPAYTVTATIPVGSGPIGVAVNPLTNTVYVTNSSSNTVSVINGSTNTVTATIPVGSSPSAVAVNPLTNTVFVTNAGSNTVSVISGPAYTVTKTIGVGTEPVGVAVNPATGMIELSSLPADITDFIVARTDGIPKNVVIRNNHFHNNRARGILLGGSNALIENNRIERVTMEGILVPADTGPVITTSSPLSGQVGQPLALAATVSGQGTLSLSWTQLSGPAAANKGMALFPRTVGGKYVALSRWDRENTSLTTSSDNQAWTAARTIQTPTHSWELTQVGNCGSPIETDGGWLVLTHGVGPMRTYRIGAILLDLEHPDRVIAGLEEPLIAAATKTSTSIF